MYPSLKKKYREERRLNPLYTQYIIGLRLGPLWTEKRKAYKNDTHEHEG